MAARNGKAATAVVQATPAPQPATKATNGAKAPKRDAEREVQGQPTPAPLAYGPDGEAIQGTVMLGGTYRLAITRFVPAVPLSELLANPFNYRVHPPRQRLAVRGSLQAFGWVAPLMVNEVTGHVVDGHLRMDDAMAVGETHAPVNYIHLSPDQERSLLAVYDPMTALAVHDAETHLALLQDATAPNTDLQAYMLALVEQDRNTLAAARAVADAAAGEVAYDETDVGRRPDDKLATFQSATTRQIVLHYGAEGYTLMLECLEWARQHFGVETNAEAVYEALLSYRAEHDSHFHYADAKYEGVEDD